MLIFFIIFCIENALYHYVYSQKHTIQYDIMHPFETTPSTMKSIEQLRYKNTYSSTWTCCISMHGCRFKDLIWLVRWDSLASPDSAKWASTKFLNWICSSVKCQRLDTVPWAPTHLRWLEGKVCMEVSKVISPRWTNLNGRCAICVYYILCKFMLPNYIVYLLRYAHTPQGPHPYGVQ